MRYDPSKCDCCQRNDYTADNPRVFMCQRRPSDPSEMCAVLAGHARCYNVEPSTLPRISPEGGTATAAQWEEWIESAEAAKAGLFFLSLGG